MLQRFAWMGQQWLSQKLIPSGAAILWMLTELSFKKVEGEKQRDKKRVLGKTMRDPGRGRKAELDPSVYFNILTVAINPSFPTIT